MAHKLRAGAALLLLAGLAAAALIASALQAPRLREQAVAIQRSGDDLALWAERLAPLIPYLPERGVLGYISERDIPGLAYSATDQGEELAMSQFLLAPRILEQGARRELVLANLGGLSPQEAEQAAAPLGLQLERAFDYGIYLFRRAAP